MSKYISKKIQVRANIDRHQSYFAIIKSMNTREYKFMIARVPEKNNSIFWI